MSDTSVVHDEDVGAGTSPATPDGGPHPLRIRRLYESPSHPAFTCNDQFEMSWASMPDCGPSDGKWFIYGFAAGGSEIARVLLDARPLPISGYLCPGADAMDSQLEYFEVARDFHLQGYGRTAIGMLQRLHPGRMFVFAGPDAASFYRRLRWREYPRASGPSPAYAELFVSEPALSHTGS